MKLSIYLFIFVRFLRNAGFTGALGIVCLLTTGLSASAQNGKRLPDSLSTAVDILPSGLDEPVTSSSDTNSGGQITEEAIALADSERKAQETPPVEAVREPAVLRTIPDSTVVRFKRDRDFAYANDPSYWVKDRDSGNNNRFLLFLAMLFSSAGFRYFIYMLLGSILLFAIYKIIKENNLQFFYRKPLKTVSKEADGLTEMTEEDLDEKLQQALRAGDHRLGVRYLFLKTLALLDSGGLIRFHIQATNQEYLRQLNGAVQEPRFRFLTEAYEFVWYGDFLLSSEQFDRLNHYFQDFYKSIPPGPKG